MDYRQIPYFVSTDRSTALAGVTLTNPDLDEAANDAATLGETVHAVPRPEGFAVVVRQWQTYLPRTRDAASTTSTARRAARSILRPQPPQRRPG